VVWLGWDPKLRRNVAIKLVKAGGPQGSAHQQARLVREAQALAQVSHPHLVQVHDVGTWRDRVYIAMEYVRGPSLAQWLARPRSWREVTLAVLAAGRGLAAAHDAGLVHRDFKPANVLVGDDGRVRVVDFGLARVESPEHEPEAARLDPVAAELALTGSLTESGTIMGTPAYMAPEQHADEEVDARCDQFSLCATLYEIHPRGSQPRDTTRLLAETLGILRGCPLVRSGRESTRVDGSRHRSSKTLLDGTARDRGASVATAARVATPAGAGFAGMARTPERLRAYPRRPVSCHILIDE
jgi:serine/threonine protein kinase